MRMLRSLSSTTMLVFAVGCASSGGAVPEGPAPAGAATETGDVAATSTSDSVTIVIRAERGLGLAKIYVVYNQGPRYLLGGSSGIRLGETTTVSIPWHPGGFAFLTSVPVQSASAIGQTRNRLSREVELDPGDVYTIRYPEYFTVGGFLFRP